MDDLETIWKFMLISFSIFKSSNATSSSMNASLHSCGRNHSGAQQPCSSLAHEYYGFSKRPFANITTADYDKTVISTTFKKELVNKTPAIATSTPGIRGVTAPVLGEAILREGPLVKKHQNQIRRSVTATMTRKAFMKLLQDHDPHKSCDAEFQVNRTILKSIVHGAKPSFVREVLKKCNQTNAYIMAQRLAVYLVIFLFFRWIYTEFIRSRGGAPPSPIRFPGIGNLIQLYRADPVRPFVAFQKLAATHGDVLSIRSGMVDLVVINGYKYVKEAMMCDSFLPRMSHSWLMDRTYGKPQGIIFSSLDIWKESRRHTIRNLRDFGFGKSNTLESIVIAEVEEIMEHLEKNLQKTGSLPMNKFFMVPIVNVVWSLIAGARFASDDVKLHDLNQRIDDYFKSGNFGSSLMTAYPFLKDWVPSLCGYEKQHNANMAMNRFLEDVLADCKVKLGKREGHQPHNFVEAFLSQINLEVDNIFNEENLVSILYDLFIAGTETTSNTLCFAFLYMMLHPEVQEKVRAEIDRVVGHGRWPSLDDKPKMTYTEATIAESFRMTSVLPLGPRSTGDVDCVFGPYEIPKNTIVLVNYYSVHMDKEFYGDPENFRPERFLNDNGELINMERLLPFSWGKRNCLAEPTGRGTVFLVLTCLLQRYTFTLDPQLERPTMTPIPGFTNSPQPYRAIIKKRELK